MSTTTETHTTRLDVTDPVLSDEPAIEFLHTCIKRKGTPCSLSTHEYVLLQVFVASEGKTISRKELVGRFKSRVGWRRVANLVRQLKSKIEDRSAAKECIQPTSNGGYIFLRPDHFTPV